MPTDPNNCGSGNASEVGYRVQVRCAKMIHSRPIQIADGIVSTEWRDVRFARGTNSAGVPVSRFDRKDMHDLMGYEAAVALAWTVIAQHEWHFGLECRLMAYRLETTYKLTREGTVDNHVFSSDLRRELKVTPVT